MVTIIDIIVVGAGRSGNQGLQPIVININGFGAYRSAVCSLLRLIVIDVYKICFLWANKANLQYYNNNMRLRLLGKMSHD